MDSLRHIPGGTSPRFLIQSSHRGGESGLVAGLDFKSSGVPRKVGSVGSIPMHLRHLFSMTCKNSSTGLAFGDLLTLHISATFCQHLGGIKCAANLNLSGARPRWAGKCATCLSNYIS